MKSMFRLLVVAAFALLICVPAALAQIPETSVLPVDEPLDVGGTILQPGTYAIAVLKRGDDNRVVVTSPDGMKVFASVLTIPHQLEPNEQVPNTTFVYYPAGEGQPRALRTWYPPNPASQEGRDIVYEESRAKQLARLANQQVPSYSGTLTETTQAQVTRPEPMVQAQTTPAPEPVAPMTSAAPVQTAEAHPMEMPHTASNLPMMALIGLLSLGAAVVVRMAR